MASAGFLLAFIFNLVVLAIIFLVVFWIIDLVGFPPRINQLLKAAVAILFLVWLLAGLMNSVPLIIPYHR